MGDLDPPVLILEHGGGDLVEAELAEKDGFTLGYSIRGERRCSASSSVPASTVVKVFDRCVRGEGGWRGLVEWRPLAWPNEDSAELSALAEWAAALATEVDEAGHRLSNDGRMWVLRRLVRKGVLDGVRAGLPPPDRGLAGAVSYDIECLVLELARSSLSREDA